MLACADGEEEHLRRIAAMVDAKLPPLNSVAGTNEARNMLFAALYLADELDEARRLAKAAPPRGDDTLLPAIADRLEKLADALERIDDSA